VRARNQAVANKAKLRLVVPSATVLRALRLVGMDDLLLIYPSLSRALAAEPEPDQRRATSDHRAAPHRCPPR